MTTDALFSYVPIKTGKPQLGRRKERTACASRGEKCYYTAQGGEKLQGQKL